jgi:mannose-6-phosphate isomerase-like protein (cupin superfamily)
VKNASGKHSPVDATRAPRDELSRERIDGGQRLETAVGEYRSALAPKRPASGRPRWLRASVESRSLMEASDRGRPVTEATTSADRQPLLLAPGEGRNYPMGRISALFKAGGPETGGGYSISEWWLDPHTQGPGVHSHPEDDIFFVIDGTMSFFVRDSWIDASIGSFVLVPGGVEHDFENRGEERSGVLNVKATGDFEGEMPGIADWFAEHPPGDAGR